MKRFFIFKAEETLHHDFLMALLEQVSLSVSPLSLHWSFF